MVVVPGTGHMIQEVRIAPSILYMRFFPYYGHSYLTMSECYRTTPRDWLRYWSSSGAVMNVSLQELRRSGICDVFPFRNYSYRVNGRW